MTQRVFRENPIVHLISRLNSPPTKTHSNTQTYRLHSHVLPWDRADVFYAVCAHII